MSQRCKTMQYICACPHDAENPVKSICAFTIMEAANG